MHNLENTFQDLLQQATNGVVYIQTNSGDAWRFFVRFYSEIENKKTFKENNTYPILHIPNYQNFLKKLQTYLSTARDFYSKDQDYFDLPPAEFDKKLILDLFTSASYYDLLNISTFIDRKTNMLLCKQNEEKFLLGTYQQFSIYAQITKNRSNMESPYKLDFFIANEKETFQLPSILFDIDHNTAYIMGIQNFNKQQNALSKKLDRYFRKVNKDVNMEEIEGNVSPNAVVSFTLFNAFLLQKGIEQLKGCAFMPLRYHGNKIAGYNKCTNKKEQHAFLETHNHIQYNITNKLMYMFLRYQHHFTKSHVFYNDIQQEITLYINNTKPKNAENIIYEISQSVCPVNENTL